MRAPCSPPPSGVFTEVEFLGTTPDTAVLQSKLAAGQDVMVTLELPSSFVPRGRAGARYIANYTRSGGPDAGHALVLAGYAHLPHGTYFLLHNSWGTGWGDAGYAWIHEVTLRRWTRSVVAVDAEPIERGPASRPRPSGAPRRPARGTSFPTASAPPVRPVHRPQSPPRRHLPGAGPVPGGLREPHGRLRARRAGRGRTRPGQRRVLVMRPRWMQLRSAADERSGMHWYALPRVVPCARLHPGPNGRRARLRGVSRPGPCAGVGGRRRPPSARRYSMATPRHGRAEDVATCPSASSAVFMLGAHCAVWFREPLMSYSFVLAVLWGHTLGGFFVPLSVVFARAQGWKASSAGLRSSRRARAATAQCVAAELATRDARGRLGRSAVAGSRADGGARLRLAAGYLEATPPRGLDRALQAIALAVGVLALVPRPDDGAHGGPAHGERRGHLGRRGSDPPRPRRIRRALRGPRGPVRAIPGALASGAAGGARACPRSGGPRHGRRIRRRRFRLDSRVAAPRAPRSGDGGGHCGLVAGRAASSTSRKERAAISAHSRRCGGGEDRRELAGAQEGLHTLRKVRRPRARSSAAVAHEINNPAAAVAANLGYMRDALRSDGTDTAGLGGGHRRHAGVHSTHRAHRSAAGRRRGARQPRRRDDGRVPRGDGAPRRGRCPGGPWEGRMTVSPRSPRGSARPDAGRLATTGGHGSGRQRRPRRASMRRRAQDASAWRPSARTTG